MMRLCRFPSGKNPTPCRYWRSVGTSPLITEGKRKKRGGDNGGYEFNTYNLQKCGFVRHRTCPEMSAKGEGDGAFGFCCFDDYRFYSLHVLSVDMARKIGIGETYRVLCVWKCRYQRLWILSESHLNHRWTIWRLFGHHCRTSQISAIVCVVARNEKQANKTYKLEKKSHPVQHDWFYNEWLRRAAIFFWSFPQESTHNCSSRN